jgi:hypothetical protein
VNSKSHQPASSFWNAIQKIKHVFSFGATHICKDRCLHQTVVGLVERIRPSARSLPITFRNCFSFGDFCSQHLQGAPSRLSSAVP